VGLVEEDPAWWFGPSFLLDESKLRPPAPRPGAVPRTAVLDRLRAEDAPVLSVVAPPGYGKSVLLAQWAEQAGPAVAWLSLERDDNDPAVLLAYLAAALDRIEPIDVDVLRTRAPPGTTVAATVARRVAATLATMAQPVTIVLDHTELLYHQPCRDAVAELAVRLPPTVRLAVASRGAPPLPVGRLRAHGSLLEVGVDDLAMDEPEARLLLESAGVAPSDAELVELVGQTEGWPVGLYLAALAGQSGTTRGPAAVAFTGDDRLLADYLRAELLSRVSRRRVSFLTRTSVLDRMSGPLCDAVLERTRSGQLLESLEGSNLFLVPLDRRREWYRYHKLFRQLLQTELVQREAEVVAALHTRAAVWCEDHGLPEMAIDHAQAAGDGDRVARLVATYAVPAYAGGRLETVCRWLAWFDEQGLIERYEPVARLGAFLMALMGQAAASERWTDCAERCPGDQTPPDGSTMESWRALLRAVTARDGVAAIRRDSRACLDGLAPASPWRSTARLAEGFGWLLDGEVDKADHAFVHTVETALEAGAHPAASVALAERAFIAIERNDWPAADRLAEQAIERIEQGHLQEYGPAVLAYVAVARTAAQRGDLAGAHEALGHAAGLRPQLNYALPYLAVQALVELGRVYVALTDPAGARVVLREARDVLRHRPDLGILAARTDELTGLVQSLQAGAVGASSLTTAELRLVPYLATHLSFPEMGERLHVSRHTVKTQAMSVYRKLAVSSRSEAIERLQAIGLLGA
jgi:LuxR family maltose regulon positive regulatory protein